MIQDIAHPADGLSEAQRLDDLAARCEVATGPDRQLDALIRCAVYAPIGSYVEQSKINGAWCVFENTTTRDGRPRLFQRNSGMGEFTASLDAAMTLVPTPGKWSITAGHAGDWQACVWLTEGLGLEWHSAATPDLALCAAALRARAHLIAQKGSK